MDDVSVNLLDHFDEAFAFIDNARRPGCNVFVHCLAGVSRSASVVVAYVMAREHVSLKDAYECVSCDSRLR